ncbi:MAG: hypothetical protein LBJ18_03200 [Rickettsiales bacterium]|jgi:hypothetical protein|nr:hypothetical protein [Rickettsiales bacterium]
MKRSGGGHIDSAMLRGIGRYLHAYKNCYKNNVLKYAKNPSAYKNKLRVANHKDYMYEFAGGKISDSVWARRDFVVDSLIRDLKIVR